MAYAAAAIDTTPGSVVAVHAAPGCHGDDAPAIQAAIDRLGPKGGRVELDQTCYAIGSPIRITTPVELRGITFTETASTAGTLFSIKSASFRPITISGPGARGAEVRNIAFAQAEPAPRPGWEPSVFPYVITIEDTAGRVSLINLFFDPVYDAILASGSGRLEASGLWGQTLHTLLSIDKSYDADHIGPVHLWPYWSSDPNVTGYTQAHADAIVLERVDGFIAPDIFVFAYHAGVTLARSSAGLTSKFAIGSIYCDATAYCIHVTAGPMAAARVPGQVVTGHITSIYAQSQIASSRVGTPLPEGAGIEIDPEAGADIWINQFEAERFQHSVVQLLNPSFPSVLRFGSFMADMYNEARDNSPAVLARSIRAEIGGAGAADGHPRQHDIGFATEPSLFNGQGGPLVNATLAIVEKPLPALGVQPAASNARYPIGNDTPIFKLRGSSPLDGVTVRLPGAPPDDYSQEILSNVLISNFSVVPAEGESADNLPSQAALQPYTPIRFIWRAYERRWERIR